MKKIKSNFPLNIFILSFAVILIELVENRFGTYIRNSNGYFNGFVVSVVLPLVILIIPIFEKTQKDKCWNKRIVAATIFVIIINVILTMIVLYNRQIYIDAWQEQHWTWSNSPPIRWDFWNIL